MQVPSQDRLLELSAYLKQCIYTTRYPTVSNQISFVKPSEAPKPQNGRETKSLNAADQAFHPNP